MFDMMKMMDKIKEVQQKVNQAREGLGNIRAEGESGGGLVKVTANGKKEIVSLEVDKSLTYGEDRKMMHDLIIAASNKALEHAEEKGKEHIKKSTEGLLPNIPGFDLFGLS